MTEDEIKDVVQSVLKEQRVLSANDIDADTLKTIATILTSFGIEEDDRKELKADFSYIRRLRKSWEQSQTFAFKAAITAIVGAVVATLWLGIKAAIGK